MEVISQHRCEDWGLINSIRRFGAFAIACCAKYSREKFINGSLMVEFVMQDEPTSEHNLWSNKICVIFMKQKRCLRYRSKSNVVDWQERNVINSCLHKESKHRKNQPDGVNNYLFLIIHKKTREVNKQSARRLWWTAEVWILMGNVNVREVQLCLRNKKDLLEKKVKCLKTFNEFICFSQAFNFIDRGKLTENSNSRLIFNSSENHWDEYLKQIYLIELLLLVFSSRKVWRL